LASLQAMLKLAVRDTRVEANFRIATAGDY
jgi:hypothetical protein